MITKEEIKRIHWYRQAGAGFPIAISLPIRAIHTTMNRRLGVYFPNDFFYVQREEEGFQFYHIFDGDKAREQAERLLHRYDKDPALLQELYDETVKLGDELEVMGFALLESEPASEAIVRFVKQCEAFWGPCIFHDLFDANEERNNHLIFGDDLPSREEIAAALAPLNPSKTQESQEALLALYEKAKDTGITPAIEQALEEHSKNYYYLKMDYEHVPYLDAVYFRKQLKKFLEDPAAVQKAKDELAAAAATRKKADELAKTFRLSEEQERRLHFFRFNTNFRDTRKRYNQTANYILITLAKRLAEREGVEEALAYCLFLWELADAYKQGLTDMLPLLQKRLAHGAAIWTPEPGAIEIIEGPRAHDLWRAVEDTFATQEELHGSGACPGTARGPAKIMLNQAAFHRFNEGDILVAPMTRPEYLPLMKKAAAIVTDEGGLTCHAAIVSRELGKPCVIGTQIASRTLKDGDLVEVDADKGVVRKV